MADANSVQKNMSKGRGNINRFKTADGKKETKRTPKKMSAEEQGYNLGTFNIEGSKEKK